jgi:hypothetical protein
MKDRIILKGAVADGFVKAAIKASEADAALACLTDPIERRPWPDPTPEMLKTPEFEAVWQCIKRWDINVPDVYGGYCGATGNHVRAILDALANKQGVTS